MARIICSRHGRSPTAFVSPKIAEAARPSATAQVASTTRLKVLTLELDDGNGIVGRYPIDSDFGRQLIEAGLLAQGNSSVTGQEQAFEVFGRLKCVCAECLREWVESLSAEPQPALATDVPVEATDTLEDPGEVVADEWRSSPEHQNQRPDVNLKRGRNPSGD